MSPSRTSIVKGGGVRWTIKNGALFDCRELLREVEEYVGELRG